VNTKSRGDQSAYLAEAARPLQLDRRQQPAHPAAEEPHAVNSAFALFYDRAWSDDEFPVHAKQQRSPCRSALVVVDRRRQTAARASARISSWCWL
jgi:hypothetical protein